MPGAILDDEEELDVLDCWNEGLDAYDILEIYPELKVKKQVYRILVKYGVKNGDRFGRLRNHDYFNEMDTKEKAYFLGLLIADGNVAKGNNRISISLLDEDRDVIEKFKEEIGSTNNLVTHCNNKNPQTKLRFSSGPMRMALAKYGVVPRKSKITFFPKLEKFNSHLVRGIFDGDGHYGSSRRWGPNRRIVGFTGSEDLITQLRDFLAERIDTQLCKITNSKNCFRIQYTNKYSVLKFIDYIYQDIEPGIFLERKYEKVKHLIG
ncbi:MAG: hypothetical protein KAS32_19900 [Candidatus Peribacteraceae bacterium]|nr:hypothetical protein [Candidatus Peribacteraceae bacterium]